MSKSHKIYTVIYHYSIATVIRNIIIKNTEDQKKNVSNIKHVNTILKIANQRTINKLVINPALVDRIENSAQQIIFEFSLKNIKNLTLFN
jgi:hypothetical protein